MYCINCQYRLHGLPKNTCPECGTTFNPDDPSTFNPEPITQVVNPEHFIVLVFLSYFISFLVGRVAFVWFADTAGPMAAAGDLVDALETALPVSFFILPCILIPYLIMCVRKAQTHRGVAIYVVIMAVLMLIPIANGLFIGRAY